MTVYTLLQTDTDTTGPAVSVYRDVKVAQRIAESDIQANGTRIIEFESYRDEHDRLVMTWIHVDPEAEGLEYRSEIREHII